MMSVLSRKERPAKNRRFLWASREHGSHRTHTTRTGRPADPVHVVPAHPDDADVTHRMPWVEYDILDPRDRFANVRRIG